jgi:predicted small lipoprotein YifL
MKKTLLFMVAGIMIFSLAACGKSDNNSDEIDETEVVNSEEINENEIPEVEETEVEEGFVYGAEGE